MSSLEYLSDHTAKQMDMSIVHCTRRNDGLPTFRETVGYLPTNTFPSKWAQIKLVTNKDLEKGIL